MGYDWYIQKSIKSKFVEERSQNLEILALSEPQKCIEILTGLWKNKKNTTEELLLLAELILDDPTNTPPDDLFSFIKETSSDDPDSEVLLACLEYISGNTLNAINQLNRVQIENPKNLRAQYEFNKILWVNGALEDRIRAKVVLKDLAEFEGKWSYKALRVLCFTPPRSGFLKEDLEEALLNLKCHSLVTSYDYLKCLELQTTLDNEYSLQEAIAEGKAKLHDPVIPEDLGLWLISRSRPDDVLDVVTEQIALEKKSAFFARFQALLETNRTKEAKDLLNKFRGRLTQEESLRAQTYWSVAIGKKNPFADFLTGAKSLNSAESLLDVARLAMLANRLDIAIQAFDNAWDIDCNSFGLDQANQYLQISLSLRNTNQAHEITKSLLDRFPYKFGNANNHCYLSLLLGEDPEPLEKEAQRIIRFFPSNPSFLSTLALAKILNGKFLEAFEAMNRRSDQRLLHGERALMAVILQNIKKEEDAQKLSSSLVEERMLPEEWALLKKYNLVKSKG